MIDIKDSNVDMTDETLRQAIKIVMNGGNGKAIYDAGLLTTKGTPVSERQARRYRQVAQEVIDTMSEEYIDRMLIEDNYMPDMVIEEEDTSYPPILVPPVKTVQPYLI